MRTTRGKEDEMTEFIFFLTYNDRTIPTPIMVLEAVKDLGVKNVGFKDVGIPKDRLVKLKMESMRMKFSK